MKILLTGANGFIASFILEALLNEGHTVRACVKSSRNLRQSPSIEYINCDMSIMLREDDWLPLLQDVVAIVNAAGILREKRTGDFRKIHFEAPKALAEACLQNGIRKYIQISAQGPEDREFISSKYLLDEYLVNSDLDAYVIRPSVVMSLRGSYGGTSLMRALAAMPFGAFVPGKGDQKLQPVFGEDVARIAVALIKKTGQALDQTNKPAQFRQEHGSHMTSTETKSSTLNATGSNSISTAVNKDDRILYASGPEVLTLKNYLLALRKWLGFKERSISIPNPLIKVVAYLGEIFGRGPLSLTMYQMMSIGNVAPAGSGDKLAAVTGINPLAITAELVKTPSHVQDRWHARLYFLRPAAKAALIIIWLTLGTAGLLTTDYYYSEMLERLLVPESLHTGIVIASSMLDIVLGLALLLRFRIRTTLYLMLASTIGYSIFTVIPDPQVLINPYGPIVKNLTVLCVIFFYMATEDER